MDNIKLFKCSSARRPSSRLYLGNHFSGFAGRAFGLATSTALGFAQGWVGWLAINCVECCEDEEADPELDGDGEELTIGLVLLVGVLIVWVEKIDCCEEADWVEVNGEVNGGKGDVISLVYDSYFGVAALLYCEWMGNSKGLTPRFSLCSRVNTPVSRNKEVTLSSEASGFLGFSTEMDIYSNFRIKEWTSGDSGV